MRTPLRLNFGVGIGRADWYPVILSRIDLIDFQPRCDPFRNVDPSEVDAFIPLGLDDYLQLRGRDGIEGKVLMPSATVVDLCSNKQAFDRALADLGFKSLRPGEPEGKRPYPYIAKSSYGNSGEGVRLMRSPQDELDSADFLARADVFRQRWLPGQDEYAAHFLIKDGRVLYQSTVRHQLWHDQQIKGKPEAPLRYSRFVPEPFVDQFTDLLLALNYEGSACIDYKVEAGQPRIMELNPRTGGSLMRAINDYLDAYLAALGLVTPRPPLLRWLVGQRRQWGKRLRRWRG